MPSLTAEPSFRMPRRCCGEPVDVANAVCESCRDSSLNVGTGVAGYGEGPLFGHIALVCWRFLAQRYCSYARLTGTGMGPVSRDFSQRDVGSKPPDRPPVNWCGQGDHEGRAIIGGTIATVFAVE